MRILTWNVNVLRTVLDYHPFSGMPKKNVEGLLETLEADIYCFQEHKTRRDLLDRATACPGKFDGFWTFPRHKSGYSGVCTYVNSEYCVPLKAEEGITGLLLGSKGGTMKPPWTPDEQIGCYPDLDDVPLLEETEGVPFEPSRLDLEGRAVVCDFGLFVLFNLYVPNQGSDARGPYKLNFLSALKARVDALLAAGREVILAGDLNVIRQPIDFGEGTVVPGTHYLDRPDRVMFESWCHPRGPLIDVVRETFPDREGMYTCWNTKIDARPANYGSRIDYILCSPGLRKWIKGGDIQNKVFGSDHCPVYIDLHDSIEEDGQTIFLKDVLNPADRPESTAPKFPADVPRKAPEPPRFATKFWDEFSGKQRTLKSLWAQAKPKPPKPEAEPSPSPAPSTTPDTPDLATTTDNSQPSTTLGIARAAFSVLDATAPTQRDERSPTASTLVRALSSEKRPIDVDLAADEVRRKTAAAKRPKMAPERKSSNGQMKLASFFSQPAVKAVGKSSAMKSDELLARRSSSQSAVSSSSTAVFGATEVPDTDRDIELAIALAEEDEEREKKRAAQREEAAPVWSEIFAKKIPPKCKVHGKPCKDFIVKQGANKGKRFWLCSLPVGPGYDMGRSKRPREQVNPEFRCDYFLWDSLNTNKEKPKTK